MLTYTLVLILILAFSLRYNWWRKSHDLSKARVLMYHSISEHVGKEKHNKWRVKPKDFENQMKWFYDNAWTSYTATEISKFESIPSKSFIITFDDGFEDNYTNAFPILKKYNFKATIYLVPDQLTNYWESNNTSELSKLLTSNQIQSMQDSGLIEFGSHTLSHVNLSTIDNKQLEEEILLSKTKIEKIIQKKCDSFAYPYGKFNEKIIKVVKKAGYTNATVVKRGLFESGDDLFTIKRLGILGTESFLDFRLKISKIRNKL